MNIYIYIVMYGTQPWFTEKNISMVGFPHAHRLEGNQQDMALDQEYSGFSNF